MSRRGLFLGIVIVLTLLPLAWTVLASLDIRPDGESGSAGWFAEPTLDHYLETGIAEPQFVSTLLTSASLAVCTMLISVSLAFLAAYSLVHWPFRGRRLVVQGFLILASLPIIAYVIPLGNILDTLRMSNTFIGTALAEAALYAPFAAYILYGYLSDLSVELEQSAQLDGAGPAVIIRKIVIPSIAPGIAATAILVIVMSWNQLLIPLVVSNRVRTVPMALIDFFTFERELEWPTAAAALITALLPIIAIVAAGHSFLERFYLSVATDGAEG